jgi:deoxyribose-phosphate aldolase
VRWRAVLGLTNPPPPSEAQTAISQGATEVDVVLAVGLLKSRDYASVHADIRAVVTAAAPYPVKVIIETFLLTDEEKVAACVIAAEAGAAFVKTCTGFSGGKATAEDVRLMGRAVEGYKWSGGGYDGGIRVKASGGVRGFDEAVEMLRAGANRIGTSSGVAIVENAPIGTVPAGKY